MQTYQLRNALLILNIREGNQEIIIGHQLIPNQAQATGSIELNHRPENIQLTMLCNRDLHTVTVISLSLTNTRIKHLSNRDIRTGKIKYLIRQNIRANSHQ